MEEIREDITQIEKQVEKLLKEFQAKHGRCKISLDVSAETHENYEAKQFVCFLKVRMNVTI